MKLSEFQRIQKITRQFSTSSPRVVHGIGDDCTQVRARPGYDLLYTVDSLVEKIHFSRDYFTAGQAGRKAVAVAVSDIAAMGGIPRYVFLALGIPVRFPDSWIDGFHRGVRHACRRYGVSVLGGNLSRSPDVFWASVFVTGEVKRGRSKSRSGAKTGDGIYVTGTLGNSALGLEILHRNPKNSSVFATAHLLPQPRLKAGAFLGGCKEVGAMIDISDGLASEINHILKASRVGVVLEADLPIRNRARKIAASLGLDMQTLALSGGEDYELLFTVRKEAEAVFIRKAEKASFHFYRIGRIVPEKTGLKIAGKAGYAHF